MAGRLEPVRELCLLQGQDLAVTFWVPLGHRRPSRVLTTLSPRQGLYSDLDPVQTRGGGGLWPQRPGCWGWAWAGGGLVGAGMPRPQAGFAEHRGGSLDGQQHLLLDWSSGESLMESVR